MVMPCRQDDRTFAASNFHTEASRVQTGRMVVWTTDLMHAIFISNARTSGPCWLASRRLDFNCDICLMDERVRTSIHFIQTVAAIFPYLCFGKKSWSLIEHWESSGRMQAGAVGSFSTQRKVRTGIHVVWTEDKASNKKVTLTYPYAAIVFCTLSRNPTWTLPNQVT